MGDAIQCPYHGLQFDGSGACVKQPFDEGAPAPHNKVKAYPAIQRYGHVWLWMGDPAKADPALLPDMPDLEDDRFEFIRGHIHFKGNYQLIADNVLDLTHVDILHQTIRCEDDFNSYEKKVTVDGDTLTMFVWKKDTVPSAFQLDNWGTGATRADVHSHMSWFAPSIMLHDNGLEEVGAPERSGMLNPSGHFVTPETETISHYFWYIGRNTRVGDKDLSRTMQAAVENIFQNEDIWMIEQQQAGIGDTGDYLSQKPVILGADGAMMRARRILARKIAAEQAGLDATAAPTAARRTLEPA